MEREQYTVVLEGATLSMGEELFEGAANANAIIGCCSDLYRQSLETFVFALIFSGKVGVYTGRDQRPGQTPMATETALTKGFGNRLQLFDRKDQDITIDHFLTAESNLVKQHVSSINSNFRSWTKTWGQHFVREVWMFWEKQLKSTPELESLLCAEYVQAMVDIVKVNLGNCLAAADEDLGSYVRRNTVHHIAAHCAYHNALSFRPDLGDHRNLLPHPTRQTLVVDSKQSLISFVVPAVLYEIVAPGEVENQDTLRQRLGDYAEAEDMIGIHVRIARSFAGSERERRELLGQLNKATAETQALQPIDSLDGVVRRLAAMRALYNQRDNEKYEAGLLKIFPLLSMPPPARMGRQERIN
jgi:hypothetical protein